MENEYPSAVALLIQSILDGLYIPRIATEAPEKLWMSV